VIASPHARRKPLSSNALHLTSFLSTSSALFYAKDTSQLFWNQLLPHSFACDGGLPPPSSLLPQVSPRMRHFCANRAFLNPSFSMRCKLCKIQNRVSPLPATLTKTAGCTPTIPILVHPERLARRELVLPFLHSLSALQMTSALSTPQPSNLQTFKPSNVVYRLAGTNTRVSSWFWPRNGRWNLWAISGQNSRSTSKPMSERTA
jgi:hypothetical protein